MPSGCLQECFQTTIVISRNSDGILTPMEERSTTMNDNQPWAFTCRACGGHKLTVTRVWKILAGPDSETWQEWGPLEADHHWSFTFKEKIEKEKDNDDEVEPWDFAEYTKTTLLLNRKSMKYTSLRTTRETTSFM